MIKIFSVSWLDLKNTDASGEFVKTFYKFLFFVSLFSFRVQAYAHDKKPWVYFDLGETVVNTKDIKNLRYMKGAREYIEQLKREGFNIGIISNIPESWGNNYKEKFQSLKTYIYFGWGEGQPFDWSVYDEVILPLTNSELKPAPILFLRAISKAESCPSVYIGESFKEIVAANALGMAAKLYVESDEEVYIPIAKVRSYIIDNYHREYDLACFWSIK